MTQQSTETPIEVILIGTGIMSATMGVLLHQLQPDWKIRIFERLDEIAGESSQAWNNAGTGHAAYCELNYSKMLENGQVDSSKALLINRQFEQSLQFWAYLSEQNILKNPADFIRRVPHLSFVRGAKDVAFLRLRYEALRRHFQFKDMVFSEDPEQLRAWMPLVMENRPSEEPVAATYMEGGTDIDFGALTGALFDYLGQQENISLHLSHKVNDIERDEHSGCWQVTVTNLNDYAQSSHLARFVFIGAGGGALPLLDKSGIPEADGYGGFPISGLWLRCTNPEVIAQHQVKVYGKAAVGTPPMSVPHLDSRIINGQRELLFGPFAGFSTKFLKKGSYLDLFTSLDADNILPMLHAGIRNLPLTRYLIAQVLLRAEDRMEMLREYYPDANIEDWELKVAGQRVQVIKKDPKAGGVLEFGTEVVNAADGSLAALLGASPGASTSVSIMLEVLENCFGKALKTDTWKKKLQEMIPSYGQAPDSDQMSFLRLRLWTDRVLGLGGER